jgi:DNA invertase Pin-like site-specific DNA recombinase
MRAAFWKEEFKNSLFRFIYLPKLLGINTPWRRLVAMKAIVYVRFSTDEQASGNSVERQTQHIESYAARNDLEIVNIMIDDGFSASKGHHISRGKLGRFLAEADKGKFQGYALIVERLDRFSRLGIDETNVMLRRLLAAGVTVHVTEENRAIRSLDDMVTAMSTWRGHSQIRIFQEAF